MGVAQDTLNDIQKKDDAYFDQYFKDEIAGLMDDALSNSDLIDRADFNAKAATKSAKGINQRSLSRAGVSLSGQHAKQADRLGGMQGATVTNHLKNTAVLDQDERNTQKLGTALNAYMSQGKIGSDLLREGANLEAGREARNKKSKANSEAQALGMATSIFAAFV